MPFVLRDFHVPKKMKAFLFLMRELNLTQADAQRYIAKGRLFVDGDMMRDSAADIEGAFQCVVFEPSTQGVEPIFQSSDFALFDKPSGVLVHPQNRNTPYSMVDEIRHRFGKNANIVHRIDQETSGLLLASRHKKAERALKMLFENRSITKRYLAMVHGRVDEKLVIDEPLLRAEDPSALVRLTVRVDPGGKPSRTEIMPIRYHPEFNMTLVEAKPETGRQHQIRVHLFHVKHPIVGDPLYGRSDEDALRFINKEIDENERFEKSGSRRLLLHAYQLDFTLSGVRYKLKSRESFEETALKEVRGGCFT